MSSYKLNLIINPDDLRSLKDCNMKITIAKPVNDDIPNVAWLVFDPFSGNTVEWEERFGIYASPIDKIVNGAHIKRISEVFPAFDGTSYTFDETSTFSGPQTGEKSTGKGIYQVINNMDYDQYPYLTFGLEQKASINGTEINPSPINAAAVPSKMTVNFTPLTTVYIWLENNIKYGTVITQINGDPTQIKFGGDTLNHSLKYNARLGRFLPED